MLSLLLPLPAHAQTLGCQYVLGFKALHDVVPDVAGGCVDNQTSTGNGDAVQHTARGLMVWRKADNWTAFTDGYRTWINGPAGLVSRLNSARFPWEAAKQFGVSIAGAEFTEGNLPGTLGVDYLYPADASRERYFAGKGMTVIRLPFRWERVQRSRFGPLSAADIDGLRAVLDSASAAGQQVILDMHNYGRYFGAPLTPDDAAQFTDAWERLSAEFHGHPGLYGYELMNEPHDLPGGPDSWAYLAQAATDAIRKHDTTAWVLVPGYQWQNAFLWPRNNSSLDVRDPAGKALYAAHLYFDPDYSGKYIGSYRADGASADVGVDRLKPFVQWLAARNANGFITEYGVPKTDPGWLPALGRFLTVLRAEPRIQGGTYWFAGPWAATSPLSIEPVNGSDQPQIALLAP